MNKKQSFSLLFIFLLSFYGFGCNPFSSYQKKAQDSMVDSLTEKIINKATDGKVNIDVRHGGKDFTIKSKDGGSFSVGEKLELPKDFPKEIPIYKNLELKGINTSNQNKTIIATFNSLDSAKEISNWYKQKLTDQGWKDESNLGYDDYHMNHYKKDNKEINIALISTGEGDDAKVTIVLTWKEKEASKK